MEKVEELNKTLWDDFEPEPIVISERYYFYKRVQKEDETLAEYIAAIRKLAINCEFKGFLDEAIRDKFVCGLHNAGIRKKLLTEKNLTLKTAIDIGKSMKCAERESKSMEQELKDTHSHKLTNQGKRKEKRRCFCQRNAFARTVLPNNVFARKRACQKNAFARKGLWPERS